jgi:thiamine-phosphate pyrophosphorylase
LVTPPVDDPARFAPILAEACTAADVAAVILRVKHPSDEAALERIQALAPAIRRIEASLLLDGRPDLIESANADGVHVLGSEAVAKTRAAVKGDRIVGAASLPSRHEAMTAGENGADYVMFGEPDPAGKRPTVDSLVERIAWWSELFVIPCVACAGHVDEIDPLVRAGADFIALMDETIWVSPERVAAALREAGNQLQLAEATA